MDTYTLLKFAHIIGFIVLGAGLLSMFISEWRAHATHDVNVFAEAARYTLIFRNSLIMPGAITITVSGIYLILYLDLGFFSEPWVVGMWGLFVLEAIEGNTFARMNNRRSLRRARQAVDDGALTPQVRREAHRVPGVFAHFLDLPMFLVMVYCGTVRPESWTEIAIGVVIALLVAGVLAATVPGLYRRSGRGSAPQSG